MRSFFKSDRRELLEKISHIPSCATVAARAKGERATEHNEGLPARVVQNSEHRALARAERFCTTYPNIRSFCERIEQKFGRR